MYSNSLHTAALAPAAAALPQLAGVNETTMMVSGAILLGGLLVSTIVAKFAK